MAAREPMRSIQLASVRKNRSASTSPSANARASPLARSAPLLTNSRIISSSKKTPPATSMKRLGTYCAIPFRQTTVACQSINSSPEMHFSTAVRPRSPFISMTHKSSTSTWISVGTMCTPSKPQMKSRSPGFPRFASGPRCAIPAVRGTSGPACAIRSSKRGSRLMKGPPTAILWSAATPATALPKRITSGNFSSAVLI